MKDIRSLSFDEIIVSEQYKKFSEIKYIVSDIDGTLTSQKLPIMAQIKEKSARLKELNVITTIATGRPYRGTYDIIKDLGISKGIPIALYNGGLVLEYMTGRILDKHIISYNIARNVIDIVSQYGVGIYAYVCDNLESQIVLNLNERVLYFGKKRISVDVNGFEVIPLTDLSLKANKIISILIEKKELPYKAYYNMITYLNTNKDISYTDSGNGFIEICGTRNKKSMLVREIRNRDKVGKILAIGDNDNDVDLFEAADMSIAVANSSIKAKNAADYVSSMEGELGYLEMLMVVEYAKQHLE